MGTPIIRPVELALDRAQLARLDTSFSTTLIYRVVAQPLGFTLEETRSAALHKHFPLDDDLDAERSWQHGFVATDGARIVGFVALHLEQWNRRAVIWHLYVAPEQRGCGIGRALLQQATQLARAEHMRCLWLETSNLNHPGIQFYRRVGFSLCGLDTTLYDPQGPAADEIALYFACPLASKRAPA